MSIDRTASIVYGIRFDDGDEADEVSDKLKMSECTVVGSGNFITGEDMCFYVGIQEYHVYVGESVKLDIEPSSARVVFGNKLRELGIEQVPSWHLVSCVF